jgi:branched-chain amino acid transport system ATP-binding protein
MSLLSAEGVTFSYGGLLALSDVSLNVERGQAVGLIGPNGAGKSTLLGLLSGLIPIKQGNITFDNVDLARKSPHRRARAGMSRTFQHLELWNTLTVRDNIRTAAEFSTSWRSGVDVEGVCSELVSRFGLEDIQHHLAGNLPSGSARVVEVARALASGPSLLLLDEPSAGLDTHESTQLGRMLHEINGEGTAVLLVEHHVELVMSLCAYVYVLDFGKVIGHGTPAEVQGLAAVQAAYLGVPQ